MRKRKEYRNTKFGVEVLQKAVEALRLLADGKIEYSDMSVDTAGERWVHVSVDEFYADYRKSSGPADYTVILRPEKNYETRARLSVDFRFKDTVVSVDAEKRTDIEHVFEVFEAQLEASHLPEEETEPVVFIGHGHSLLWRDLKDHLHEQHGLAVEAYETGARAGHAIRDILEEMAEKSAFALLVMTAEDIGDNGSARARQNVVHEMGLFQGRLGFARAIAIVEEGVEVFSNLDGIHQIRFSKGNIKETYGDVLATIRREFS